MNQITAEPCGGRNRSRTCDLFLVMEALVPTELCARVPGRLYRRFAVRRKRWRHEGTAPTGQRRDHATRRQQAAHAEDDPGHAQEGTEAITISVIPAETSPPIRSRLRRKWRPYCPR